MAARAMPMQVSSPEETAARALRWFLRGGSWEALVREPAWAAVRATGVDQRSIEWLAPLVEARLAERVDGLEFLVDRASTTAWRRQVRCPPQDLEGGAGAAVLDGYEEGLQVLSRLYLEVLEWAADLINERISGRYGRGGSGRFRVPLRRRRPPADLDIPLIVAEQLTRDGKLLGLSDHRSLGVDTRTSVD